MKQVFIFLILSIFYSYSFAQSFSEKTILLSNTGASAQTHVIVAANFGPDKDYYVKYLDGIVNVFAINNNQEVEVSSQSSPNPTDLVDFQDFNNDGLVDILTNFGPMYNLGDEVFGEVSFPSGANLMGRVKRYVDFNNDGILDMVATFNGLSPLLTIYLVDANQEIFNTIMVEDNNSFDAVRIADFNNDGDNDLIYLSDVFGGDRLVYLENMGGNNFQFMQLTDFNRNTRMLFLTDLDQDQDLDIITPGSSDLDWVENIDGDLGSLEELNGDTRVLSMDIADLNDDGFQDIVVLDNSSSASYKVLIFFSNGDGTLQAPMQIGEIMSVGPISVLIDSAFENWIQIKDINNDGRPDILVNEIAEGNYISFFNEGTTSVSTVNNRIDYKVFPNPSNEYVMITSNEETPQNHRVRVYSVTGNLLMEVNDFSLNNSRLDIGNFNSGMYLLEIVDSKNGNTFIQKMIKE